MAMNASEPLVDYAAPMMRIEKLLKDTHNFLLEKKFREAIELSSMLTAETRLLHHILVLMEEKQT
jgi:hypothetical protein